MYLKCLLPCRSVVYRLAYFVRQSGVAVYPLGLPHIPHPRWVSCGCLSVTGISGSIYKLYAGSVVDRFSWIPASYSLSLSFQKQVSTLDYAKLEQTIEAAWAPRHGSEYMYSLYSLLQLIKDNG